MATTFMDKQRKQLIKKFHVLLGKAKMDEQAKRAFLSSYEVESTSDLDVFQLMNACQVLELQANPELKELDKHRKRLIAAVFGYFKAMGRETAMTEVKAVACRAAKCKTFNAIPKDRLISLYNAFKNRVKDIAAVHDLSSRELLKGFNPN